MKYDFALLYLLCFTYFIEQLAKVLIKEIFVELKAHQELKLVAKKLLLEKKSESTSTSLYLKEKNIGLCWYFYENVIYFLVE